MSLVYRMAKPWAWPKTSSEACHCLFNFSTFAKKNAALDLFFTLFWCLVLVCFSGPTNGNPKQMGVFSLFCIYAFGVWKCSVANHPV